MLFSILLSIEPPVRLVNVDAKAVERCTFYSFCRLLIDLADMVLEAFLVDGSDLFEHCH